MNGINIELFIQRKVSKVYYGITSKLLKSDLFSGERGEFRLVRRHCVSHASRNKANQETRQTHIVNSIKILRYFHRYYFYIVLYIFAL